jgi:signal transduction histidine kinase
VEAPGPAVSYRGQVSLRIYGWILRSVELPVALAMTTLTATITLGATVLILMAVAAAAWVAWLVFEPPRSERLPTGPAVLTLLATIAGATGLAAVTPDVPGWIAVPLVVACMYAATSLRRRGLVVPLTAVAAVAGGRLAYGTELSTVVTLLALIGGFYVGGTARGLHHAQLREARAGAAERERAAALAERTRIAREVHDILAHSLADLSIQLELADALLTDAGDTTGARDRVRHAHRLAADGLTETRRAVHALRSDTPPLPDALGALAGASNASFETTGTPRPLPAAAGLALLRTAQEALVNAAKHAPGTAVSVILRYDPQQTGLTVRNTAGHPQPPDQLSGGYGLAGMRERLRLVGGSLTAGSHPGGWTVHAEVPQ